MNQPSNQSPAFDTALWWRRAEHASLGTSDLPLGWDGQMHAATRGVQMLDRDLATQALARLVQVPPPSELHPALALLQARFELRWGQPDSARAALKQLATTADAATRARAWHSLGVLHIQRDKPALGELALVEALRLAEESPSRNWILDSLGQAAMWQGAWTEARYLYHQSTRHKQSDGDTLGIAITLGNVALLELGLGNAQAAVQACQQALSQPGLPALTRLRLQTLLLQGLLDSETGAEQAAMLAADQLAATAALCGPTPHHLKGFAALARARAQSEATARETLLAQAEVNFSAPAERALVHYWRARLSPGTAGATLAEDTRSLLANVPGPCEAELLTELLLAQRAQQASDAPRMLAHLQRADRVALRGANPLWVERVDRVYRQLDPGGFGDRVTARFTGRAASELSRGREEIVTSIFADVVGFTRRFEKLGAQEVMDTIRSVFERAVPLFERHRVRPHQYQGDGLVAEAQGPNHESRAIAFAKELLTCMNRTSLVRTITGDPFGLQIRVGVATGLVVTGALGSQYKMEYLSIGRSVNMAARLQAEAQPGELVCAQATAKAAGQPGQLEEFQLKGFAEKQQGLRIAPGLGDLAEALA